jgi:hypothetical protein
MRANHDDVMIDIETLGTNKDSVIATLGAIRFNRFIQSVPKLEMMDSFYRRVDHQSCLDLGMTVNSDTLNWWKRQPRTSRYEVLEHPERSSVHTVLSDFNKWLSGMNNVKIWAKGTDFDCVILGEAYKRCNIPIPWKFWNVRDVRTVMDLASVRNDDLPQNALHNCLYDCHRQIVGLNMSFRKLGL